MNAVFREPARSLVFGDDAETYDDARPGYPAEVIDLVVRGAPATALDVGCGTGKAATSVMQRNVAVLGIEPDARMAAVARRHGVQVVCARFEDWQPTRYDSVFSAQAWHWVDPDRGAAKTAEVLPAGGQWTAFWNWEDDVRLTEVLVSAYSRFAPRLLDERRAVGSDGDRSLVHRIDVGFRHTGAFGPLQRHDIGWVDELPVGKLVDRLSTSSGHRLLGAPLTSASTTCSESIGNPNEVIVLNYTTMVLTACRE